VSLDVSRDGGATWTAIADNVANTTASAGSYNWHVTGPTTPAARIRARWSTDPVTSDISNVDFAIVLPAVTVTQPNTALNWRIGSTQTVRVAYNLGAGQLIALDVSRDGGASWTSLAHLTTGAGTTASTYSWLVTGPPAAAARIRAVWEAQPEISDTSNVNFAVLERITVTAPNTNVSWTRGSVRAITWTHNLDAGSTVNVELTRDNGGTWETIATNVVSATATTGTLAWTVTGTPTQSARIRISSTTDPTIADESNVTFRIP
jgi:hypothetical protein